MVRSFSEERYLRIFAAKLPPDLADQLKLDGGVELDLDERLGAEDLVRPLDKCHLPTEHLWNYCSVLESMVIVYEIEAREKPQRNSPWKIAYVTSLYLACYANHGDFTCEPTAMKALARLTLHALEQDAESRSAIRSFLDWFSGKLRSVPENTVASGLLLMAPLCLSVLHLQSIADHAQSLEPSECPRVRKVLMEKGVLTPAVERLNSLLLPQGVMRILKNSLKEFLDSLSL